jgi:hypothetical protein
MADVLRNITVVLTPEQAAAVDAGEQILSGLLKDATKNTVTKHVPTVAQEASKELAKPANASGGKGWLIGLGITAFVAVAGAVTYGVVKHKQKKKEKELVSKQQINQLTYEYNKNTISYIRKATTGTLTFSDIKSFSDKFDEVLNHYKIGDIKIELSEDQINALYEIVYSLTMQLIDKTGYQIENKELLIEAPSKSKEQKMEDIKEYVYIQRKICEEDK